MALQVRSLTAADTSLLQRFLLQRDDEENALPDDEERQKHGDVVWCHKFLLRRNIIGAVRGRLLATLSHEVLEMEQEPPWTVDISNVYVLEVYRHQKIGTALMTGAITALERTPYYGAARLDVECANEPAIALYEKFGFRKRAKNLLTLRGRDAVCWEMVRELERKEG